MSGGTRSQARTTVWVRRNGAGYSDDVVDAAPFKRLRVFLQTSTSH